MADKTLKPGKVGHKRSEKQIVFLCLFLILPFLGGCLKIDPLKKHKLLTTIFDGIPALPAIEELCEDNIENLFNNYYEKRIAEASMGDWENIETTDPEKGSAHKPWAEKNCLGCHNFKAENKLKLPLNELCFLCHKNFIQGTFVHGPVAVGACVACHKPHSTSNPSLLEKSLKEICFKCHKEKRLAEQMHAKIIASGMYCVDCHDPHSSNVRYFLK